MHTGPSQADRKIAVWLFAGFLAFYISLTRGHFYSSDEVQVFQQTRSLWERGNLSVTRQINTTMGPDGRYYAQYGIGQTVLAVPFYVTGKKVHEFLRRRGADSWIRTFEGPFIGEPARRWGGEVEIFFVNLFCAFAVAALMSVFYLFNIRLGASQGTAILATIILGITTHVAGFSVEFMQHPAEALFLLLASYFLFIDAKTPGADHRWLAGAMAGMMILVRASALVLIPALAMYLLWHIIERARGRDRVSAAVSIIRDGLDFLLPVIIAILITRAVNHAKFGAYSISGSYGNFNSFTGSYLISFYGWLFSPGQSVFVFSPILILAPLYFRPFIKKHLPETMLIFGLTASYALLYGIAREWHGQWCFGPRFLMPIVPLLLLPLAPWLEISRPLERYAVVLLALIGGFVEVLHVAVNVSFVHYREGFDKLVPPEVYIFVPQKSQLVAHWRALLAHDDRVDMWLLNVAREFGLWRVIEIVPGFAALILIAMLNINSLLCRCRAQSISMPHHSMLSGVNAAEPH